MPRALIVPALATIMVGCESGEVLLFQNRTGDLVSLRVTADHQRRLEVVHEDTERERRAGQQRFLRRPAAGLQGISADTQTFGPIRVNPDEIITLRVHKPKKDAPVPTSPVLYFEVAAVLSMGESVVEQWIYEPMPELVALTATDRGFTFEFPIDYDPAPAEASEGTPAEAGSSGPVATELESGSDTGSEAGSDAGLEPEPARP